MIMLLKFSNFPDELSENDKLREFELSMSDCTSHNNHAVSSQSGIYILQLIFENTPKLACER